MITFACDICGCGVGSYYIGILPDFNKRFVGLRYQHKSLTSHLSPGGERSYLTTDEKFHTLEVWGAWNVGKKFRLMYLLPLNGVVKINQGRSNRKMGLGDPAVLAYYNLAQHAKTTNNARRVVQSLWVGGGIKLPVGKYSAADKEQNAQQVNTFQLGTGSIDFSLNTMYDLRIQDAGININSTYKINMPNKQDYVYGNKWSSVLLGYYKLNASKLIRVSPNAGMMYEKSEQDYFKNQVQDASGGSMLLATYGVELTIKQMSVGVNMQHPLTQNLGKGIVRSRSRSMIHLSYGF
jgi:hypothetical protein